MRVPILFTLFAVSASVAARAQVVSIYGTSSTAHFSSVETGTAFNASGQQNYFTSFWTSGIGGGVTFNFLPVGPVKLGFDMRGSTRKGTSGADTAMVGFKVAIKPPAIPVKPYVQASGGYIATRTPNTSTNNYVPSGGTYNNQYIAWEILGGVDYPILRVLDLRVIEVGGGTGYSVGQIANGSSAATVNQQIPVFTINSGLVVHF